MKKGLRGICLAATMTSMLFSIAPIATPVAHAKPDWGKIAGDVIGGIINNTNHKKGGNEGGKNQDGGNSSSGGALNQKHARPNPTHEEKLFLLAVESNDYETAQSMLDAGVDIDIVIPSKSYLHETALSIAMYYDNREMMQFLLERGANVNGYYNLDGKYVCYIVQTVTGHLHHYGSNVELIKYLHDWGANINGIDSLKGNALNAIIDRASEYSRDSNDIECARYLVENGIDLEKKQPSSCFYTVSNRTPFIAAVNVKWYDMAKLLADYGANINARDNKGKTALDIALEKKDMQYYKQIQDIIARGQQPSIYSEMKK